MNAQTIYAEMKEQNAALLPEVAALFADFCRNPAKNAKFLNTLSLLEHIGSRKIMMSQTGAALNRETLKHLAEETRHAYFFKRCAEKITKQELNDYSDENCLAPSAAKMYFGRLDAGINNALNTENPTVPYLYVSFIVELRACWLYTKYQEILKENQTPISLKSILAEEGLHLQEMHDSLAEAGALDDSLTTQFIKMEQELFTKLWRQIEASAQTKAQAA